VITRLFASKNEKAIYRKPTKLEVPILGLILKSSVLTENNGMTLCRGFKERKK